MKIRSAKDIPVKKSKTSRVIAVFLAVIMAFVFSFTTMFPTSTTNAVAQYDYYTNFVRQPADEPFNAREFLMGLEEAYEKNRTYVFLNSIENTEYNKNYICNAINFYVEGKCGRGIVVKNLDFTIARGKLTCISWNYDWNVNGSLYKKYPKEINQISGQYIALNLMSRTKYKIYSGDSQFTKIHKIHDYVASTINHRGNETTWYDANTTLIDSFARGSGTCWDFSSGFQVLCDYYNIPCIWVRTTRDNNIVGTAYAAHAFNMVQLGQTWYYLDCTKDAPGGVFDNPTHNAFLDSLGFFYTQSKEYCEPADLWYDSNGTSHIRYVKYCVSANPRTYFYANLKPCGYQVPNASYNYPTGYLDEQECHIVH